MPTVSGGNLKDRSLRAWLARSDLSRAHENVELLERIARTLGLPYSHEGLGALRFWGQTGERPGAWIAAADPVYLEPRLDFLWLHALASDDFPTADLGGLVDHLQQTLGDDERLGFTRLGTFGYLQTSDALQTANVSSTVVNQGNPGDHLPQGATTASYRNLLSEIEMALHEHAINRRRAEQGFQPVNSLWIWGGGVAPDIVSRPQPPLFANDPLLLGYWASASASASVWPGDITSCLDAASDGFVAVVPQQSHSNEFLEDSLEKLRRALQSGRLGRLTLLFRDGLAADVRRSHAYRIWRRDKAMLDGVKT
jgi:hypothetical protein